MKKEGLFKFLFAAAALFSVLAVVVISLFLFASAFPTIKEIGPINFLFGKIWKPSNDIYGIFPMIVGSVYVTGISILIGVPLGLFTALYMTYFAPKRLYRVMKPAVELLAGIPSIVYGFFGLMVLVPLFRSIFGSGKSIMTASVLGGTLILKYGKKAGWTLWGLWMIGCFTLPRISDAAPNTPAGLLKTTLQRFLHILPPFLRIALIAAIMILCIICSWLLLRRQQVNS